MKKMDMIEIIVNSPAWDGTKNKSWLYKNNTKEEIKDIYDMIEEAEEEYYSYRYGY